MVEERTVFFKMSLRGRMLVVLVILCVERNSPLRNNARFSVSHTTYIYIAAHAACFGSIN